MDIKVTVTPMLDEKDGALMYEVQDANGNATNCRTIDDALETVRRWTASAKSLESMAQDWIIGHGSNLYDDIREDIETEYEIMLTEDQWDSFANMIEHAKITVEFPYRHGAPTIEGEEND